MRFMLRRVAPFVLIAALLAALALAWRGGSAAEAPPPCAGIPVALDDGERQAVYCLASADGAALAQAAGLAGDCYGALAGVKQLRAGAKVSLTRRGGACDAAVGRMPASQALLFGLPLDLNAATAEELAGLPGIGEKTARAIVEEREANGAFASPDDLARVKGVGPKTIERLRGMVAAGDRQ
jgi:competence ComEA-like helix-hairpin-helix protein